MTLGEQIKDYIYIEDIVSAYIHFIEKNIEKNCVYNVSTEQGTSLRDLVKNITSILELNDNNIKYGAVPYRKEEPLYIVGSNQKLLSEDWKPKYSIQEGLKKLIESYNQ